MIDVKGLRVSFGALDGVSLQVERGEFVCLLGPSGCGKSTLLNAVAGFVLPSEGSVEVDGKRVERPGPDRAVVFQEYALFPWLSVEENVAFGLQQPWRERVDKLLETMKLREFAKRWPRELSGGMRQRVALARALALDAPVLLMDEPFGALDALTRRSLQQEVLRLHAASKTTVLFVTHSIEESLLLASRVVVMTSRPGRIKAIVTNDPARREELSAQLTALVMEEQARHERDELTAAGSSSP